jgi:hypothetical protein
MTAGTTKARITVASTNTETHSPTPVILITGKPVGAVFHFDDEG